MAGERALPGLGLLGFWDPFSSGWDTGMDENLRKLSALVQPYVLSRVASLPGSPTNGDVHIVTTGGNANDVALRDNGSWVYLTPGEGWVVYDRDTDEYIKFTGSAWEPMIPAAASYDIIRDAKVADYTLVAGDFTGRRLIEMDVGVANEVTVPPSLTVTEPVHFVQIGIGQTEFIAGAGVTIRSAGGLLKLRERYSVASLIPQGTNTYLLVGDLAA